MSPPLTRYKAVISIAGIVRPVDVYLASDVDRLRAEFNDQLDYEKAKIADALGQINATLEAAGIPPIVLGSKP